MCACLDSVSAAAPALLSTQSWGVRFCYLGYRAFATSSGHPRSWPSLYNCLPPRGPTACIRNWKSFVLPGWYVLDCALLQYWTVREFDSQVTAATRCGNQSTRKFCAQDSARALPTL